MPISESKKLYRAELYMSGGQVITIVASGFRVVHTPNGHFKNLEYAPAIEGEVGRRLVYVDSAQVQAVVFSEV